MLAAYLKLKQLYDFLDVSLFEEFDAFKFLKHIIPEIKDYEIKFDCGKNGYTRRIKDILIDPTMGEDSMKTMKSKISIFFRGGGKTERDSLTLSTRRQLAQLLTTDIISAQCDHLRDNVFSDGTHLNEKLEHLVERIRYTECAVIIDDSEIHIGEEAVRVLRSCAADMCDKFCILMLCAIFQKQFVLVEEAVSGYLEGSSIIPHDELAIMQSLPELRRDELLQRITSEIRNPKRQLILLNGELGIGKTTFLENNLSYELQKMGYKIFTVNYERSFFYSIVNNLVIDTYSQLGKDEEAVFAEKLHLLKSLATAKQRLIVIFNNLDGERLNTMLSDSNKELSEIKKAIPKIVFITSQTVDNSIKLKSYTDTAEPFSEQTLTSLFRNISGVNEGGEEQISRLLDSIGRNTFLTVLASSYVGSDDMLDTSEKLELVERLSSIFAAQDIDTLLLNEQLDIPLSFGRYSGDGTILEYLQRLYDISVVKAHKELLYKISFLAGSKLALSILTRLLGKTDTVKRALNDLTQFRWIKVEEIKGKKYISMPSAAAIVIQQNASADMTDFAEKLCKICKELYRKDDDDAIDVVRLAENCISSEYFNRPENIHIRLKLIQNTALLQGKLGRFFRMKQYEDEAIELLEKRIVDDKVLLCNMYNSAAVTRIRMGNFVEAIEYIDKAISLADTSDTKFISALYNNKASALIKIYRFSEALSACNYALELRKQTDDNRALAISYHNLSNIHIYMGEYEQSVLAADEALSLYDNDKLNTIKVLLLKARCICRISSPTTAEELMAQAREMTVSLGIDHIIHDNIYQTEADISEAQNKLGAAIVKLNKARDILSANNKYVIDGVEIDTGFLSSRELAVNSQIHRLNYINSGGVGVYIMYQELVNAEYCLQKLTDTPEVVIDVPIYNERIIESVKIVAANFSGAIKLRTTSEIFRLLSIDGAVLVN